MPGSGEPLPPDFQPPYPRELRAERRYQEWSQKSKSPVDEDVGGAYLDTTQ